jgi:hypothetical protein
MRRGNPGPSSGIAFVDCQRTMAPQKELLFHIFNFDEQSLRAPTEGNLTGDLHFYHSGVILSGFNCNMDLPPE